MAAPVLPQQLQQAPRQRHIALFVAFPPVDVDEHALAVDIPHLQVDPLLQAQAAGIDGAQADPVARAVNAGQNRPHFSHRKHHRQLLLPSRTNQLKRGPLPLQGVLKEELDRTQRNLKGAGRDLPDSD